MIGDRERQADLTLCGAGTETCCAYLTVDGDGAGCARATSLATIIERKVARGEMRATRLPDEPFPDCQKVPA